MNYFKPELGVAMCKCSKFWISKQIFLSDVSNVAKFSWELKQYGRRITKGGWAIKNWKYPP